MSDQLVAETDLYLAKDNTHNKINILTPAVF
jgi:hypothetical protein